MGLVYGNILLLVCVIIELLYVHFSRKEPIDMTEVTANINSGHILLFIFRSLGLAVYYFIWNNFNSGFMEQWPEWWVWIFTIIAWDFCYYWSHRLHHYFSLLWYVHQVHHEGEHFNLSLGLRNSWYSTITSLPFFLVLAMTGVPLEIFMPVSALHYFIQFLNHSQLVRKIPWVEKLFITPSDHRVHHGKNEPYVNKNFGGTFVIWDKIFRTFQPEKPEPAVEYGIPNRVNTANTLVINNSYFLGRFFIDQERRLQQKKYTAPTYLIVTGCLILFGLLLCYLSKEQAMPGTEKFLLFTIIFLGTIANG
jgi:sterol desaturase/sphingolipid hydroxylase (fatty acid hydroxylase superfamily)